MQWRAALWISSVFCMSPTAEIEAISGLIPIHLHLKKLYSRFLLRGSLLPSNHIIKSILSSDGSTGHTLHSLSLDNLTPKQRFRLNSPLINIDNSHNELLPFFLFFDKEFDPGNQLIDSFPDWFSFHPCSSNIKNHIRNLNNITFRVLSNPSSPIIISDTSIKNHVATSILYIHSHDKSVIKTIHWAVNITTTKAKLFAMQCGINQVVGISNINHIIIIIDSLHTTKRIFDSSLHLYQIHSAMISHKLREFFLKDSNNHIRFWDCPSKQNWPLHSLVDKDSKSFDSQSIFPCKLSWDYCKKHKYDSIFSQWKMFFQALDLKGRNFLELLDSDQNPIELSTINDGSWLQHFSHSNSLCARVTRAIINHAPTGEYQLRFFPREEFSCLCGLYPIESRQHILHDCKGFNNYWNPRRDTIAHFSLFLELNSSAFSFG